MNFATQLSTYRINCPTSQGSAAALSVQLQLSVDLSVTALLALIPLAQILTIKPSIKPCRKYQYCEENIDR